MAARPRVLRTRRPRAALACIAAVSLLASGCGGGGKDSPEVVALKRQIREISERQYARAWEELHPSQQAFIPKDLYVRCSAATLPLVAVKSIRVTKSRDQRIRIPGTTETAKSRAITVAVTSSVAPGPAHTETKTYHEVKVGNAWRLTLALPGDAAATYRRGVCPVGS